MWDVVPIIDALDPRWAGYYFDVRHAVVEGGDGGWRAALNLVAPRLKMIAVKDFFWEKGPKGWQQRNCPLGEGMVDWKAFFAALARSGFHGPVSLHLEYEIPGATPAAQQENTLAAAARDLAVPEGGTSPRRTRARVVKISRRGFLGGLAAAPLAPAHRQAARATDIRIAEVRHGYEDYVYRAPYKFGGRVVDRVTLLNVRCRVETRAAARAPGASAR